MNKILAIDGSLASTGYCVADETGPLLLGRIVTSKEDSLPGRLYHIYQEISTLIRTNGINTVLIESKFVGKNPQTGIDLGRADAAIMLAARAALLPVYSYTPSEIKRAATGKGNATKPMVQDAMVRAYGDHSAVQGRLKPEWMGKGGKNKCDDLADALAIWYTWSTGWAAHPV